MRHAPPGWNFRPVPEQRQVSLEALLAPTPSAWLDAACEQWQELLIDHAYCEKKAASTALSLIFAYPECTEQKLALARLAREELRHFEQVTRMMQRLGVDFRRLRPGRYAAGLRSAVRTHEPQRRLDLLLTGALLGRRQCSRDGGERRTDLQRTRASAASSSAPSNSGHGRSVKYTSVPALCQSMKLLIRSSPEVRTSTSTGGRSGRATVSISHRVIGGTNRGTSTKSMFSWSVAVASAS